MKGLIVLPCAWLSKDPRLESSALGLWEAAPSPQSCFFLFRGKAWAKGPVGCLQMEQHGAEGGLGAPILE